METENQGLVKMKEALIGYSQKMEEQVASLCNVRPELHQVNLANWSAKLKNIRAELNEPQMLLFIGPFSSGKSSFINAILGVDVLPTADRPCTSVVTELRFTDDGQGHRGKGVLKEFKEGPGGEEYHYEDLLKMVDGPKGVLGVSASYHHIELTYDITQSKVSKESPLLKAMCEKKVVLVDCPGFGSPYASNEEIVIEYVSKATHTFWINPIDSIGGGAEINQLQDLKKRTTTLIPIISKADKVQSERERRQISDKFARDIGYLFKSKDPVFCSSILYRQATDLLKGIATESLSDDERNMRLKEVERLTRESGMENAVGSLINANSGSNASKGQIESCAHDLNELMAQVKKTAEIEEKHWKRALEDAGWVGAKNERIESAQREVSLWISTESDRVGKQLDDEILECIQHELDQTVGSVSPSGMQEKVSMIWSTKIEQNLERWSRRITQTYGEQLAIEIEQNREIELPAWLRDGRMMNEFRARRDVVLNAVKDAGAASILEAGMGATLLGALPAIKGITLIGSALCPVATILGGALVAVAAVSFIPAYSRYDKGRREEQRRESEKNIKKWLSTLHMRESIYRLLEEQNDKLARDLMSRAQKVGDELIAKHMACEKIVSNVSGWVEDLRMQLGHTRDSVA